MEGDTRLGKGVRPSLETCACLTLPAPDHIRLFLKDSRVTSPGRTLLLISVRPYKERL